jgi:hypothetical protein
VSGQRLDHLGVKPLVFWLKDASALRVLSISRNRCAIQYKKLEPIVGFKVFPANEEVTDGARTGDLL